MIFLVIYEESSKQIIGHQCFPLTTSQPHILMDEDISEDEIINFLSDKQVAADEMSLEPLSGALLLVKQHEFIQEQIQLITDAVQFHMDDTARNNGYDSIASAVTYAEEPEDLVFQNEGKSYRKWRSKCWRHCYNLLEDWQNGVITDAPTPESTVLGLPALVML